MTAVHEVTHCEQRAIIVLHFDLAEDISDVSEQKSDCVSPKQKVIMDTEIEGMCDCKVTVLWESDYTSPLILVKILSPLWITCS